MHRWLDRKLEAALDPAEADTELGYDPDDHETELGDTVWLDSDDDEGETELYRPRETTTELEPRRRRWAPAFEESDDEPPTVRSKVTDLLGHTPMGLRPQPLPVGTSDVPAGLQQAPAPLFDAEETWTESRLRQAFPDDRTAPSLFPTPEDEGKEQRPYPPPPTPTPPARSELPAVVTSSLIGMAVAALMVVMAVGALILWMSATAP